MASGSESIRKEEFGTTTDGKEVFLFTLKADDVTVRVLNFGCIIKDILVPDKNGVIKDVVLGHDTFDGYRENPGSFGCICGRVANQIYKSSFYDVSKNGFKGFSRRYFDWRIESSKLILTYVDGTDLSITVTYELTKEDGLMVDYKAETKELTPVDISNHCMFNLAGHDAGYCGDHVLQMNYSARVHDDIRTGEVLDLQKPTLLSTMLDKTPGGDGLHCVLILNENGGDKKRVARVCHPGSGRYAEVYTTDTTCAVFSCYFKDKDLLMEDVRGKGGTTYQKNGGLLFMPQGCTQTVSVNFLKFPNSILRPGETYKSTSWYKFGVEMVSDIDMAGL